MAFVSAGPAPKNERAEDAPANPSLETASKLFYLIAAMDQTNNESLNSIRDASQNLRTNIDQLKTLTANIKELSAGLEIK